MKLPPAVVTAAIAVAFFVSTHSIAHGGSGQWTITGWNNLGMHCMDDDYSVFSILPPFNTINVQLMDAQGHLVTNPTGLTLTYEAVADPLGSINSTSAGKTNFWAYAPALFGANLLPDQGLAGKNMPGPANVPQPMDWDANFRWFNATGIPITPLDDRQSTNTYPLMKLSAKNAAGATLATVNVVLPVSSEVDCRGCHAPGSNPKAMPAAGWIETGDGKRDHRLNILLLHDEKNLGSPLYAQALLDKQLLSEGLYQTVIQRGTPILCASCHASEALGTGGYPGVKPLTSSVHGFHADVLDPKTQLTLDSSANRTSCYQCHPGSTTKCLRGAMGSAVAPDGSMAMQCQSCHGSMSVVGAVTRTGWLDEPNCQSCHTGTATSNNGQIVYNSVFDRPGHERLPVNLTFATNPNTPAVGKSLFRFSQGHGGLQCEACHGSTHAEFPTSTDNDNLASKQLQGHIGKLAECTTCHATMPNTVTGGPHGLHPLGQSWTSTHQDLVEHGGALNCQTCHGADFRGTRLSRAQGDRVLALEESGSKRFWRGQTIGCYDCHNGPNGEEGPGRRPPVVRNGTLLALRDQPKSLPLAGTGALSWRIVSQPVHGTVGLVGTVATYFPEPGFVGSDSFTFAASNGFVESNLGATKIRVSGSVNGVADFVPPRITPRLPVNRARVHGPQLTVTGIATDKNGINLVEFRIGTGPWQAASGTTQWSATITGLVAGPLTLSFRATDAAGNQSAVIQRFYTVL
jgi:hypothetical protein